MKTAISSKENTGLAHKVLALLDGLTINQIRDVLTEAEMHVNDYTCELCTTTVFRQKAASQASAFSESAQLPSADT